MLSGCFAGSLNFGKQKKSSYKSVACSQFQILLFLLKASLCFGFQLASEEQFESSDDSSSFDMPTIRKVQYENDKGYIENV